MSAQAFTEKCQQGYYKQYKLFDCGNEKTELENYVTDKTFKTLYRVNICKTWSKATICSTTQIWI